MREALSFPNCAPIAHCTSSTMCLTGYSVSARARHHERMAREQTFLRAWRKHREMTQEDLAAAASVDRTVISKLETSKIGYTQETLEALSSALRCKTWQLIGVDPLAPAAGVVDIWERIPDVNKEQARRTLQSFTDGQRKA